MKREKKKERPRKLWAQDIPNILYTALTEAGILAIERTVSAKDGSLEERGSSGNTATFSPHVTVFL